MLTTDTNAGGQKMSKVKRFFVSGHVTQMFGEYVVVEVPDDADEVDMLQAAEERFLMTAPEGDITFNETEICS